MPAKMKQLLDMLGVAEDARMYADTSVGSDQNYGEPIFEIGENTMLFPPLSSNF